MSERHQYVVSVEPVRKDGEKSLSSVDSYTKKEIASMDREDFFFAVKRKDAERYMTNANLRGEHADLMKLLTSLSTLGIGAMLFNVNKRTGISPLQGYALFCMALSLAFAAVSYIFSIVGLSLWEKELTDLKKPYEEMSQMPNFFLYFCIGVSGAFFIMSSILYFCYVSK